MVINPIVGVYIPIIRIPIKGGMTIPNIATFDHGTYIYMLCKKLCVFGGFHPTDDMSRETDFWRFHVKPVSVTQDPYRVWYQWLTTRPCQKKLFFAFVSFVLLVQLFDGCSFEMVLNNMEALQRADLLRLALLTQRPNWAVEGESLVIFWVI